MSDVIKEKILNLLLERATNLSTLFISKNVEPNLHYYQTKYLLLELEKSGKVTLIETGNRYKFWRLKDD